MKIISQIDSALVLREDSRPILLSALVIGFFVLFGYFFTGYSSSLYSIVFMLVVMGFILFILISSGMVVTVTIDKAARRTTIASRKGFWKFTKYDSLDVQLSKIKSITTDGHWIRAGKGSSYVTDLVFTLGNGKGVPVLFRNGKLNNEDIGTVRKICDFIGVPYREPAPQTGILGF